MKPYFLRIKQEKYCYWRWEIVTYNGHCIIWSHIYKNKTQCYNVVKKFADAFNMDIRIKQNKKRKNTNVKTK